MTATILTPADLAAELGTDARTTRKFLRAITPKEDQPGKGARWAIKKGQVRSLRPKFNAWQAEAKAKAEAKAEAEAPAEAPATPAEDAPEVEAEGPTDEELMLIENEA